MNNAAVTGTGVVAGGGVAGYGASQGWSPTSTTLISIATFLGPHVLIHGPHLLSELWKGLTEGSQKRE